MKNVSCFVLCTVALGLGSGFSLAQEQSATPAPTETTEAVVNPIAASLEEQVMAFYKAIFRVGSTKYRTQALGMLHPQSPARENLLATMNELSKFGEFWVSLTQPKFVGIDSDYAFVRVKSRLNVSIGQTESYVLVVLKQDKGQRRIWNFTSDINKASNRPTKVDITPAARALVAKAAKLYGATPRWSAEIGSYDPSEMSNQKLTVAFARPSKMRIEDKTESSLSLKVADGKTLADYMVDRQFDYSPDTSSQRVSTTRLISLYSPATYFFGELLTGKSFLEGEGLNAKRTRFRTITAKTLAPTNWKGQSHQRVLFEQRDPELEIYGTEQGSYELWFNPRGELVRVIDTTLRQTYTVNRQNFNPTFTAQTFAFKAPPKPKGW